MIKRKSYKFRLNIKNSNQELFFKFAGCCRFVWNKALALNKDRLQNKHKILRYFENSFWLTLWKSSEEYGFLKSCSSHCLQQKLKDLDKAFKDCFDKKQPNKRFPKFKKKGAGESFRYPADFKINGNNIYLPKLGWFKFRQSRKLEGIAKNVTVSFKSNHWYVSIQTEMEVENPIHQSTSIVGIDQGVANFAALSDGSFLKPKNSFKTKANDLAKLQRSLARKVRFSNNFKKTKTKIGKLHTHIANIRQDFLHKLSSKISKNHAVIVMEDLKIYNMSKSAKGNAEKPGKNVKAKSGLNRVILDQGWSEFKRQLEYKSNWLGGKLLFVDPRYTSQTCCKCGSVSKENRKTQSKFKCMTCNHEDNADINAAKNILRAGHAQLAFGDIENISFQAKEPPSKAA